MSSADRAPTAPNFQDELAKERNRRAADRTILAWVRLSLLLISTGFGIDQTVEVMEQMVGRANIPTSFSRILGLALVGLGVYVLIMAAVDYRGELHRLQQPGYTFTPRYRLGETVAIALLVLSLLVFSHLGVHFIV